MMKTKSGTLRSIFRGIFFILGCLLCLPVILLPVATAVPVTVWVFLIGGCMACLVLQLWIKPAWLGVFISLASIMLVSGLSVAASQYFANTPPILDANGIPIPDSIATLEKVNLNGSEQWISIRGKDINNPVLLFLAGGPGGSQLVTARRALSELEDHLVVVNWEQPGSGKSFNAVPLPTLTPEKYIQDGLALTAYLRQRFDEEKIYVLGESWGSALGIWLVQREPDSFHAFIGTGQMVSFLETDRMCYEFVLNLARERGDAEKIAQLEAQGPPPYYGAGVAMKEAAFLMETFDYMNADPKIADDGFNTFQDLAESEYGLYDKVNWFRGALDTLGVVYPQLWDVDLRHQAAHLEVPVYFLLGRHDVNAPPVITESYYEIMEAPHKEIIWFERSGHNPWVTESDSFVDVVVNNILAETQLATK